MSLVGSVGILPALFFAGWKPALQGSHSTPQNLFVEPVDYQIEADWDVSAARTSAGVLTGMMSVRRVRCSRSRLTNV